MSPGGPAAGSDRSSTGGSPHGPGQSPRGSGSAKGRETWTVGVVNGLGGMPVVALLPCLLFLILILAGVVSVAVPKAQSMTCTVQGGAESPPPKLVPIYQAASEKHKLGARGPAILAAINFIETGFGTNMGPSSAGAQGWMQFMPATWEEWGVDANGDGVKDPADPQDAIFAAARYLRASGAPGDWHSAIFAYNHAEWYVEDVLAAAKKYSGPVVCSASESGPLGDLPEGEPQRLEAVATWIESKRLPYCWGGGHVAKLGPSGGSYCWNGSNQKIYGSSAKGLDCSGAVRWLLALAGYGDTGPIVSGEFAGAYPSGPGRVVTIWSNATHVFITINGRDWGTSTSNYAHGPGWASHTKSGFVASHPKGL